LTSFNKLVVNQSIFIASPISFLAPFAHYLFRRRPSSSRNGDCCSRGKRSHYRVIKTQLTYPVHESSFNRYANKYIASTRRYSLSRLFTSL